MTTIGFSLGGQLAASAGHSEHSGYEVLTTAASPDKKSTGLFDAALDRAVSGSQTTKVAAVDAPKPVAGAVATDSVSTATGGMRLSQLFGGPGGARPVTGQPGAAPALNGQATTGARPVAGQTVNGQTAISQTTPTPTSGTAATTDRERARRALELDAPAAKTTVPAEGSGDAIIEGMQKLRGVFDAREAQLGKLMSHSHMDVNTMMAMQMELVRFSLLVEVTSKLTGKSTQAFDTLMKGQ
ncbi:type III secretion system inner rod subunit SctI [Prosthecodimorpha staleyi]|uniref:Type III secretion system inner rod subunit SctI n=1 Tax=Prosthecodimorpha staleyi TaxID=2840188 RepID=A0A947D0L4_9HYPH|nr:type III secretion system inner rod subunit SctI [Prosthecodimorpha staleyi]MBT9288733.1 type III secretion system inner rod subunit SctI [Prosthecodimorpha staleyi]